LNVEIAVSDTGVGIGNADQKKLFQRYGQTEAGKRKANSTGLGLYLSRQIIQGHCGQIGCKSEVGVGSTFFVRLPVSQNTHATVPQASVVGENA
jgi:two-component system sensor histidine kinase SenX3